MKKPSGNNRWQTSHNFSLKESERIYRFFLHPSQRSQKPLTSCLGSGLSPPHQTQNSFIFRLLASFFPSSANVATSMTTREGQAGSRARAKLVEQLTSPKEKAKGFHSEEHFPNSLDWVEVFFPVLLSSIGNHSNRKRVYSLFNSLLFL